MSGESKKGFKQGHRLSAKAVDPLSVLSGEDQELVRALMATLEGEGGDGIRAELHRLAGAIGRVDASVAGAGVRDVSMAGEATKLADVPANDLGDAREGAPCAADKSHADLLLEVEELNLKLAHFDAAKLVHEEPLQQPAGSALSSKKRSRGAATPARGGRICPACAFEFPNEADSGEAVGAAKVCCAWWCGSCWSAEMCRVTPRNLAPAGTTFDSNNAYKCEGCGNLITSFEAHTLHSGASASRRIVQLPDRRLFMLGKKIRNWLHNCLENKDAQAALAVQVFTFEDNKPLVYQAIFDNSVTPLRYFKDTRASQAFHVIMAFIGVRVFGFGNHNDLAASSVGDSCRSLREFRRRAGTSASEDGGPASSLVSFRIQAD
jgi:hypothetical protein